MKGFALRHENQRVAVHRPKCLGDGGSELFRDQETEVQFGVPRMEREPLEGREEAENGTRGGRGLVLEPLHGSPHLG